MEVSTFPNELCELMVAKACQHTKSSNCKKLRIALHNSQIYIQYLLGWLFCMGICPSHLIRFNHHMLHQ